MRPFIHTLHELPWPPGTDIAVAIGVFDGVHRGHQLLLKTLRVQAAALGARTVAITFEPHPRTVLNPSAPPPPLLSSLELKARLLRQAGVEAVVALPFTRELATQPPEDFIQHCLLGTPFCLRLVCVGAGWRFGHRGHGDTALLRRIGARVQGFRVKAVHEAQYLRNPISSTRIRLALREGRFQLCHRLLGRPPTIEGEIEHGKGLGGKELSCPTANVNYGQQQLPPPGVYAANAILDPEMDDTPWVRHPAVAYIGPARTMAAPGETPQTVLECHLFDYEGKLYGRRIAVELLDFVRHDRVFPTVAALKDQISLDLIQVREHCRSC